MSFEENEQFAARYELSMIQAVAALKEAGMPEWVITDFLAGKPPVLLESVFREHLRKIRQRLDFGPVVLIYGDRDLGTPGMGTLHMVDHKTTAEALAFIKKCSAGSVKQLRIQSQSGDLIWNQHDVDMHLQSSDPKPA